MLGFEKPVIDVNDPDRTIFLVPEPNLAKLEAAVAKLSKKAEKIEGYPIIMVLAGYQFRDNKDGTKTKMFEVVLDIDPIKYDGWRFVARIDHANETGNIVRAVPNTNLPESFRTVEPNCDHCNHRRMRRDTFVLLNDDGSFKQVGSTCLVDFFGHDVKALARHAELAGYAREAAHAAEIEDESDDKPYGLHDRRYVDLDEYLGHVAAVCRKYGWISATKARENEKLEATRWTAMENMSDAKRKLIHIAVTDADRELAADALAATIAFEDKDFLSEYEHNVLVIAKAAVIEYRSAGLAAAIVGTYWARLQPKVQKTDLGDMKEVLALFERAGSKLKHPKINLTLPGVKPVVVLSVAGPRASVPGSITVASQGSYENNEWFGRILRDGRYTPSKSAPVGIEAGLLAFAANPAKVAAEHGHKTGSCCFCNRPLNDARSTEVGYGATCAGNYGLPWGNKVKAAA